MHYIWIWIQPINDKKIGLFVTHGENLLTTLEEHPELPQRNPDRTYSRDHAPSEEEWEQVVKTVNRVFNEWVESIRKKGKKETDEAARNPFRFV